MKIKERLCGEDTKENPLEIYLREIKKIPLLTKEEEKTYARRARNGDAEATEKLVKSNLRFVVYLAMRYNAPGIELGDLINEGNLGLMKAVEKFDPDREVKFSSYAVWWIKQAIINSISQKSKIMRLPLNRVACLSSILNEKERLEAEGKKYDLESVADSLGISVKETEETLYRNFHVISLESYHFHGEEGELIKDTIPDENRDVEGKVMEDSLKATINYILTTLSKKEADIIMERFGLNGYFPKTLQEIGDKYNFTREWARQIEQKAMKKLRNPKWTRYLECFLE